MSRRFLAALSILSVSVLLAYALLLNPNASASPQELKVISQTRGNEVLTAQVLEGQVRVRLKNNHKDTITAFVIRFNRMTVTEDFAYSEVHFGIEPGDTFEKDYALSTSTKESEVPTLSLLTVLLKDGSHDGNAKVAQKIKDERLGEKIQTLRVLRILGREGLSHQDIKAVKGDIAAAFDADEYEARIIRKELLPASGIDDKLSDDLKNGLHWGREKMLQKFQTLEQLPTEQREQGLIELKDRTQRLFAKL
ncbi:MAG TPA: hypothetical protein VFS76_24880 [Pyrinomonadaceae bacterium]|nr:hypothetical protein [Pyrinomonadaceae bacterium]